MIIDAKTRLLGAVGSSLDHSLSPVFHNAALQHLDLPYVYLVFNISMEDFEKIPQILRILNIRGLNIAFPYKEKICFFLDDIYEEAEVTGVVNTIVNQNGRLIGYNTDVVGFCRSLAIEKVNLERKNILILGSGGAAKSIVFTLSNEKVGSILVANRTFVRAQSFIDWVKKALSTKVNMVKWEDIIEGRDPVLGKVDVVINTTTLGLKEERVPISWDALSSCSLVIDLVYKPGLSTPLLQEAKQRGIQHFDGKEMLIQQGAESFWLFTGERPPLGIMEEAIENFAGS